LHPACFLRIGDIHIFSFSRSLMAGALPSILHHVRLRPTIKRVDVLINFNPQFCGFQEVRWANLRKNGTTTAVRGAGGEAAF
jgi:hypothetical protein